MLSWCTFHSTFVLAGKLSTRLKVSLYRQNLVSKTNRFPHSEKWVNLPNLQHFTLTAGGPDADDVFAISDAHNRTTDLLASFTKLVANEGKHQVLPVSIGDSLLETNDPLAAFPVLLVLPYGSNAFLK